jgi:hypothetical protein
MTGHAMLMGVTMMTRMVGFATACQVLDFGTHHSFWV